ncbi:DUF1997 domain-containing protein [[Limnothrix rosea] IAM M-220]|uniref:DUF1997 domain-containing protein n=1 Tax=[Limnothrix rosea] IAM M-220 TaxID=454133 RepID=UPI0009640709|nr:DUF1997 domain-containing protein [[Limnothrix rosea] IAM M-220]OKH11616.1 hypothetical protein NIES208_17120 [[Limnothrix rosea] IAM M-220]
MQSRFAAVELVRLEAPELSPSIDTYLQQIDRVVGVIANPDLTEKLAPDQFRLKMQPIGFLDLYQFQPIVTLRIWCDRHNVVHLKSLDYEFRGLEAFMDGVELTLVGTLASTQDDGGKPQLSGKADLSVTLPLPPPLWLTPKPLLQATGDRLLSEVLQRIKQQILKQLIQDYIDWTKTVT